MAWTGGRHANVANEATAVLLIALAISDSKTHIFRTKMNIISIHIRQRMPEYILFTLYIYIFFLFYLSANVTNYSDGQYIIKKNKYIITLGSRIFSWIFILFASDSIYFLCGTCCFFLLFFFL